MTRFLSAALLAVLLFPLSPAIAQDTPSEPAATSSSADNWLMEKEGGFAFLPPKDWQITEFGGLKYRIAIGPAKDNFAPNINVVDEKFAGPMEEYVVASLASLQKLLPGFKEIGQVAFATTSGIDGKKIVSESTQMERVLRQTFYVFKGKDRYYVITCTATADDGDSMATVFDDAIKSFKFLD